MSVSHRDSSQSAVQTSNDGNAARETVAGRGDLFAVLGSALYLLLNLFMLRGVPILLGGDQVYFWMYGQRMLFGERVYKDFFQFAAPGTDVVYQSAFQIFGQRIWVTNLVVLMLGVVLCWLCFRIARQIVSQAQALLAAALFLIFIYGKLLSGTHHWFSELAVLGAVAVLMGGRSTVRVVLAGILLGGAAFFTQTRGPVAAVGIIAYFAWDRYRTQDFWCTGIKRICWLLISFIVTWASLSSYWIATIGWRQLWYWQVDYVLRFHVTLAYDLGLPNALTWRNLPANSQYLLVYLALPVVYGLSLWRSWRQRHELFTQSDGARMILTLTGLATAVEVARSPNWLRGYCVAAPAILLLVWLVGRAGGFQRYLIGILWTCVFCVALYQVWTRHSHQATLVQTRAGVTVTTEPTASKLEWIGSHTRPGDFFLQAAWPSLYLPLQLRNPVFADTFATTDESRPEFVAEAIRRLRAGDVRYILWSQRLNYPDSPELFGADHLGPLRDFLRENYRKVRTFSDQDEIWERK